MIDKRALKGINKNNIDRKKDKNKIKTKELNKLKKIENIKEKENWNEQTKTFFEVVKNELIQLGILYEIDLMQLYTAFDLFHTATELKNNTSPEDKEYIAKIRVYKELINECFKMLKDYYINPACRMKAALELQELENKENKNSAAIDLLKDK